jgi:primosomal protein N' (replication factor Y)
LCRACGHRFACTICDAWLVDHRFRQRLVCHHCGSRCPGHLPHCAAKIAGREQGVSAGKRLVPNPRTMVHQRPDHLVETMRSRLNENRGGRVASSSTRSWWRRAITPAQSVGVSMPIRQQRRSAPRANLAIAETRVPKRRQTAASLPPARHPVMALMAAIARRSTPEIDANDLSAVRHLASLIISAGDRRGRFRAARRHRADRQADQVLAPQKRRWRSSGPLPFLLVKSLPASTCRLFAE